MAPGPISGLVRQPSTSETSLHNLEDGYSDPGICNEGFTEEVCGKSTAHIKENGKNEGKNIIICTLRTGLYYSICESCS